MERDVSLKVLTKPEARNIIKTLRRVGRVKYLIILPCDWWNLLSGAF